MRVLFLLPDSPVRPSGGVGEKYRYLLPLLSERLDVDVFCIGEGGEWQGMEIGAVYGSFADKGHLPFQLHTMLVGMVEKFIDQRGIPDLIVAVDYHVILSALSVAFHRDIPVVPFFELVRFGWEEVLKLVPPQRRTLRPDVQVLSDYMTQIEQMAMDACDTLLVASEYYRDLMIGKYSKKTKVVPNGLDMDMWSQPTEPYEFPGGYKHNLVYIGRMSTQKGVDKLFDLELPEDTALHFVGGAKAGDLWQGVCQTAHRRPEVFQIPFVEGVEKVALLRSADAVLFPSIHEPFGIVGLEAMIARTPLITTRQGGIGGYCPEDACIPCESTPESIRAAITTLMSMSSKQRKALTDRAHALACKYDWVDVADLYTKVLEEAVSE
jgi:glycosyltransferase involved in cell wall biosynthesis